MTASTRFLGLAVLAWAGVRAVSLGIVPGAEALSLERPVQAAPTASVGLPPIEPTEFAPIDPPMQQTEEGEVAPPTELSRSMPSTTTVRLVAARPMIRAGYGLRPMYEDGYYEVAPGGAQSAAAVRLARAETSLPAPRAARWRSAPYTTDLPPARVASAALPGAAMATPAFTPAPLAVAHRRRLEMASWALLRGKPGDLLGPNSLAANSATLGGSQAGARISYWITPHLAASLRSSTPLGGARGGEVAAGVRYQPFLRVPFSITAERRQRFGRAGGRNDFALFAEGGLWDRPMPLGFRLDGYAQAGVVGIRSHDLFADGALAFTRPLFRNISAGFGVWGGAQPHLYRLDAGPRMTVRMTKSMRVHLDYRQRLLGSAYPSSGPAVTIAGDF